MSIIEAASVGVKTLADGTLRLSVDIEPRHAQAAFALFGSPGTAMALAALRTAQERAQEPAPADPTPEPGERKGGNLSQWLALRCKEKEFQDWLTVRGEYESPLTEQRCAEVVRAWCHVGSRAELDHNADAAKRFHNIIRGPYSKHLIARGVTV